MSALLLFIVAAGFAPTLYLRAFFDVPPVPWFILLHGAVMTLWYLLFFTQTSLVAADRIDRHRTLGVVGACVAVGVVVSGIAAHVGLMSRTTALQDSDAAAVARVAALTAVDFAALLAFALCVALALLNRGDAVIHKRLMLFASIAILGPALARIAGWPVLGALRGGLVHLVSLSLLLAPVVYDLIGRRRGRLVSSLGALLVFGLLVAGIMIGGMNAGLAFARFLG